MQEHLPLDFRLARLTVSSLRNLCEAQRAQGASNLTKEELVDFVTRNIDRRAVEDFCAAQEEIYFIENMAKAIKWAPSRRILSLDPESDYRMVNAVFTMKRSDATGQRLAAIFLMGGVALNYPIVSLFTGAREIAGVPLLYAYVFMAWVVLVALMAWVIE